MKVFCDSSAGPPAAEFIYAVAVLDEVLASSSSAVSLYEALCEDGSWLAPGVAEFVGGMPFFLSMLESSGPFGSFRQTSRRGSLAELHVAYM